MRYLLAGFLLIVAFTLVSAQDKPDTAYEDRLFGLRVNTEGFTVNELNRNLKLVEVSALPGGRGGSVQLTLHRETQLAEHAQVVGAGMLLIGMRESERKNARLGTLRSTLIEYEGNVEGRRLWAWVMLAQDKDDLWSLGCVVDNLRDDQRDQTRKLFDDMAKSFRNNMNRINTRRPPADSVLACERFGFSIDTAGGIGKPKMLSELPVFVMQADAGGRETANVLVAWNGRADLSEAKVDDMITPIRGHVVSSGYIVKDAAKARFGGREAVLINAERNVQGQLFAFTMYFVPGGCELYQVSCGWAVNAGEEAEKKAKAALATVRLTNPGKSSQWPGQKR
jgi:hypothetical protein